MPTDAATEAVTVRIGTARREAVKALRSSLQLPTLRNLDRPALFGHSSEVSLEESDQVRWAETMRGRNMKNDHKSGV